MQQPLSRPLTLLRCLNLVFLTHEPVENPGQAIQQACSEADALLQYKLSGSKSSGYVPLLLSLLGWVLGLLIFASVFSFNRLHH